MTEYQDARSRWWLAYLAFVIMALFAGSSEATVEGLFRRLQGGAPITADCSLFLLHRHIRQEQEKLDGMVMA